MNKRISIHIATKDRHSELALLLQSLRTQTFKNWDLVILDESQTSIMHNSFIPLLLNMIKLEGHYVNIKQNDVHLGVCNARNMLIDIDYFNNDFVCRLDDDVIIEPDYLSLLLDVIKNGYDIASGITPIAGHPLLLRDVKHVKPIINKKEFDQDNNLIKQFDDCGYGYLQPEILPTHEFRSNALMKKEVVDNVKYPKNLSPVGFREEGFFSTKALMKGYKIGVHTKAIAYHFRTPSGGCRYANYNDLVISDDTYFKKWLKDQLDWEGDIFDIEKTRI